MTSDAASDPSHSSPAPIKPALKSIGPKKGTTKSQPQPIKFVGIQETSKTIPINATDAKKTNRTQLPRLDLMDDFPNESDKRSVPPVPPGTPTSPPMSIPHSGASPRCTNNNCQYNQLAQSSNTGMLCVCGYKMTRSQCNDVRPSKHDENYLDSSPTEQTLLIQPPDCTSTPRHLAT